MRTSVLAASVALIALALLTPIEARCVTQGCRGGGVQVASNHAQSKKSSAEKESSGDESRSRVDLGDTILEQGHSRRSTSDDYDTSSSQADEKYINTPNLKYQKKSFNIKSQIVDNDSNSESSYRSTKPDYADDCSC